MTRPLPEALRPNSRTPWRATPARHEAHQRTADPRNRTVTAHDPNSPLGDRAEHDHIVALIASKYNTRRPRDIAAMIAYYSMPGYPNRDQITAAIPTLTAAEELRNRTLALNTPTGRRTPQARYQLPEQLAAHHADPKSTRPRGLDIASIAHHGPDRATYLNALRHHGAHEQAILTQQLLDNIDHYIKDLTHTLATTPRQRQRRTTYDPKTNAAQTLALTPAENAAFHIAIALARHQERAERAAKRDRRNTNKQRREQRRAAERPGHERPATTDELSGWHDLVVAKPPREIAHLGRLGRKRTTSDTGKTPNRIANYCGDPLRRIYSRKTRGTRALVIVDCSGSMSLSESDLDAILKASNGATVIGYSANNDDDPNTYLLAHNQRRVRTLPDWCGGNGVDGPAVSWAIKHYRKHNAPVLWITDGQVTGRNDNSTRGLKAQCRRLAHKHGLSIAPNVATALADLNTIANGQQPRQRLGILD